MKYTIIFIVILTALAFVFFGCEKVDYQTPFYPLRKVVTKTQRNSHASGGFFLFSGGFNYSSTEEAYVTFSWKSPSGAYFINEVPLGKVGVILDDSVEIPSVSLIKYQIYSGDSGMYKKIFSEYHQFDRVIRSADADKVLFKCHPSQWPERIEMPLNKEKKTIVYVEDI